MRPLARPKAYAAATTAQSKQRRRQRQRRHQTASWLLLTAAAVLLLVTLAFVRMMVRFHVSIDIESQYPSQQQQQQLSKQKFLLQGPERPDFYQEDKNQEEPDSTTTTTTTSSTTSTSKAKAITKQQQAVNEEITPTLLYHHTNFTGHSTVTALSDGMDRYTHVCLRRVPGRYMELRTYGHDGDGGGGLNATMLGPPATARYNYFRWILRSHPYPAVQWTRDASRASVHLAAPTVVAFDIFGNPGHCLSDLMWSVSLDRYQRNFSQSRSYPYYVFGDREYLDPTVDYRDNWCLQFLQATRWFGTRVTQASTNERRLVCFDELWVPSFSLFRFPLYNEAQVRSLRHYPFMWKNFRTHDFNSKWNWQYPIPALERVRTAVAQSLDLSMEPWPTPVTTTASHDSISISFLDRLGRGRRQWMNADAVRDRLLQRFPHVHVDLVHDAAWGNLTFLQQAKLLHDASHVVMVHAGAEANLIFCRPGTRVVELACLRKVSPSTLSNTTEPPVDPNDTEAWQGPTGWYSSFTRPLGLQHFVLSDALICTGGAPGARLHDSGEVVADVNMTVRFLASRFGLL